ncbi:MAG: T9SS type A sorting domain-containing protein [Salibacteraceae bacterium]|nr:T9SS type A sorting domain-containing protein [Salibacteraceae bacterium]
MKNDLLARLKKYALSAAAFTAAGGAANAQIQYTDIIPDDTVTGGGASYALDLNNDGTADFNFFVVNTAYSSSYVSANGFSFSSNQIKGIGVSASNSSNGIMLASNYYPYALSSGNAINAAALFTSSGALAANITSVSSYSFSFSGYNYAGSSSNSSVLGNWQGATDKYLGLKVQVGTSTYFGWARLTVLSDTQFVIKDYAIQVNPFISINAGDTFALPPVAADSVINVVGADVANNGNGQDLNVQFNMIADETTISAYRILVVKEPDTLGFDLAAAMAVSAGNFTNVTPTGANISTILTSSSRDIDGDLITENIAYRVYVMTIADGVNAQANNLSAHSNQVILAGAIFPSDPATSLAASDIADNGNGSDIQVFFTKASNENKVDQYRVLVVKASNAASFNLAQAQAAPTSSYFSVNPNGSLFYTSTLNATLNDVDGDPITTAVPYRLFVLSVADGTIANTDVLSNQSNSVTLSTILPPEAVQNITIADVADNHNGLDLQVTFDKIADETTISEYQILIVKSASAASFTLFDAIGNPNNESVTPTGANITTILTPTSKDSDGDPILENAPYKAFVLSVANGTTTQIDQLSTASNEVTLLDATGIENINYNANLLVRTMEDQLTINLKNGEPIEQAEVFNTSGQLITTYSNVSEINLPYNKYSSGIYLVKWKNSALESTIKIVLP